MQNYPKGEKMKQKIIIGALHLMPLISYPGYSNYNCILEKAKLDLQAFEEGGVDMVVIENNYNLPHQIKEKSKTVEMMLNLSKELQNISKIHLGISVLWNDYESAFLIAKKVGAKFIRVPVFVDSVKTIFGQILAEPEKVLEARRNIGASDILIYADIQVKHAEMLNPKKTLFESAQEAKQQMADGIIITGNYTGKPPSINDLNQAREAVGIDFPIIIGSGADKKNIKELLQIANGVIVSTSLKEGDPRDQTQERNIKPYQAKIDINKVKEFVKETLKINI